MFLRELTVFLSRDSVLLGLFMLTKRVVMLSLVVMVCGGMMMSGRLVMVLTSGMFR